MADEEEITEEGAENAEVEPKVPVVTHVTNAQWFSIVGLLSLMLYAYWIWPSFIAPKESDLKDPQVYLDFAKQRYQDAHHTNALPKGDRIKAFQETSWGYSTSLKAGAKLGAIEYFCWGEANYEVAQVQYPGSRYALVKPIESFEQALKALQKEYDEKKVSSGKEEADIHLNASLVSMDKVRYMLGLCYLQVDVMSKAIPHLNSLKEKKALHINYLRRKEHSKGREPISPVKLGSTPKQLRQKELYRVDLLLGRAYHLIEQDEKAAEALDSYLESTRQQTIRRNFGEAKIEPDIEARFDALTLLGEIQWKKSRDLNQEIKKKKGLSKPSQEIAQLEADRESTLIKGGAALSELFQPRYQVYGLIPQRLQLAEINYHLGKYDQVIKLANGYNPGNRIQKNEMMLWKIKALLAQNPNELVEPFLHSIAEERSSPQIQLAAFIILGDSQVVRGQVDLALGKLVYGEETPSLGRDAGSYNKAVQLFNESSFDNSPFISKLTVIDAIYGRALKAREQEKPDRKLAISLYSFLLESFTVPKAHLLHQIAMLKRMMGHDEKAKNNEEEAKRLFKESAETFLMAERNDVAYDMDAMKETHFQAAESYFDGEFYSRAYDVYGTMIRTRSSDPRISKARHKRGISALYRKPKSGEEDDRYERAISEFLSNLISNVRSPAHNKDLPSPQFLGQIRDHVRRKVLRIQSDETFNPRDTVAYSSLIEQGRKLQKENRGEEAAKIFGKVRDALEMDELVAKVKVVSRDLWAYRSLLELGNVLLAQHKYDMAEKVYQRIKNDSRFTPQSDVWIEAAYAHAELMHDRVDESDKEKNWTPVAKALEDILNLYDIRYFDENFSPEDQTLKNKFRRKNALMQFLLAKVYLAQSKVIDPDGSERTLPEKVQQSVDRAKEMLDNKDLFSLLPANQSLNDEMTTLATEQKTEALLADGLFRLGKYREAMEHYRIAHDRNLGAYERPFYSLSIVDCLEKINEKEKAVQRLKRVRWEFESDKVFLENHPVMSKQGLKRKDWLALIDQRIASLEG
ncbi:MAG: hypothetical protein HQL32_15180 [Planctomycetes bacterium]|nr:hypothetical protein [Planctomycetota bacterium]